MRQCLLLQTIPKPPVAVDVIAAPVTADLCGLVVANHREKRIVFVPFLSLAAKVPLLR